MLGQSDQISMTDCQLCCLSTFAQTCSSIFSVFCDSLSFFTLEWPWGEVSGRYERRMLSLKQPSLLPSDILPIIKRQIEYLCLMNHLQKPMQAFLKRRSESSPSVESIRSKTFAKLVTLLIIFLQYCKAASESVIPNFLWNFRTILMFFGLTYSFKTLFVMWTLVFFNRSFVLFVSNIELGLGLVLGCSIISGFSLLDADSSFDASSLGSSFAWGGGLEMGILFWETCSQ